MVEERTAPPQRSPVRSALRIGGALLLGLVTLFGLQFALQALFNAPLQGLLALVATAAFGVATYRVVQHRRVAGLLFVATLPLFLFSLVGTLLYADESPVYAVASAVPPLVAGALWLMRRGAPAAT